MITLKKTQPPTPQHIPVQTVRWCSLF